jgi:hypothetical protein
MIASDFFYQINQFMEVIKKRLNKLNFKQFCLNTKNFIYLCDESTKKKKIENTHIITKILTFERFINEPLNYSSKP